MEEVQHRLARRTINLCAFSYYGHFALARLYRLSLLIYYLFARLLVSRDYLSTIAPIFYNFATSPMERSPENEDGRGMRSESQSHVIIIAAHAAIEMRGRACIIVFIVSLAERIQYRERSVLTIIGNYEE